MKEDFRNFQENSNITDLEQSIKAPQNIVHHTNTQQTIRIAIQQFIISMLLGGHIGICYVGGSGALWRILRGPYTKFIILLNDCQL